MKRNPVRNKNVRSVPALLFVLLAVGLLGLVVGVSLSQSGRAGLNDLSVPPTKAEDRWDYSMTDLVGQTRHFKGSPDAPVTILEFSDFQ